jgi:hypothetical protein
MPDRALLAREIDKLEDILAQIAAVTARTDAERRKDLVALRRALSAQIHIVGQASEPVFAGTDDLIAYRAKFSRMRSMAAIHQASWPAIMLGERPAEYRESVRPMREANRDFIAWTRAALSRLA